MSNGEHPFIKWAGIIATMAGLLGMALAVFFYLEDLKWNQSQARNATVAIINELISTVESEAESKRVLDAGWLELDQSGQVRLEGQINGMLAALDSLSSDTASLSVSLAGVIRDQASQFQQREQRFEELENEHKLLIQEINDMHSDVIHSLGRHEGRHETCR